MQKHYKEAEGSDLLNVAFRQEYASRLEKNQKCTN